MDTKGIPKACLDSILQILMKIVEGNNHLQLLLEDTFEWAVESNNYKS